MDDSIWGKEKPTYKIWWKYTPDVEGEFIFSFDKVTEFNMFRDYPWKLTPDQKKIFDEENPYWAEFFNGKKTD